MASVAAALKERGFAITGADQGIYPPMSTFLEERGIEARPFDEANKSLGVLGSPTEDLEIHKENKENPPSK